MKVIKFGGSSLANGAAVAQAVRIIQADPARQVIVTSAPGKRHHDDTKVTDLLIQYAQSVQNQQNSQAIIGVQMASAYAGSTFMPPLFGFIAGKAGITLYPAFLFVFVVLMIVMNELLNRTVPMKQIKGS